MIEGITILAQETITPNIGATIFSLVIAGTLLIAGIVSLILGIIDESGLIGFSVIVLFGAFMFGALGFSELSKEPYIQYKVLIDQDVSWSEVYERYEIIDQEGQIYTIKEK